MSVYVMVCNYHCVDNGDFATDVMVYETFEKAQEEMQKLMVEVRGDFKYYDTEETEYSEGDMAWSIWESGEWVNHHCDIVIYEREVIVSE